MRLKLFLIFFSYSRFTINNWLDSTRNKKIIQVETDSAAQKRKTSVEAEPSKKEVVVPPANNATKSDDIPKRKSISKQNSKSSQEEEQSIKKFLYLDLIE